MITIKFPNKNIFDYDKTKIVIRSDSYNKESKSMKPFCEQFMVLSGIGEQFGKFKGVLKNSYAN